MTSPDGMTGFKRGVTVSEYLSKYAAFASNVPPKVLPTVPLPHVDPPRKLKCASPDITQDYGVVESSMVRKQIVLPGSLNTVISEMRHCSYKMHDWLSLYLRQRSCGQF